MNQRLARIGLALLTSAGLLAVARHGARAQAPAAGISTVKDFKSSDYFDEPNQDKIRFTITGAEAQQQSGGRFAVKQARLEIFRLTGEREIIVETPECLYDSTK